MLSFDVKAKYSFQVEPRRLNKQWSQTAFRVFGKEGPGGFNAIDEFLVKTSKTHLCSFQ